MAENEKLQRQYKKVMAFRGCLRSLELDLERVGGSLKKLEVSSRELWKEMGEDPEVGDA